MSRLRRYYSPGQIYFITLVTLRREEILARHADLFTSSLANATSRSSARLDAWVLLPEHFHAIIVPGDDSLSTFVHRLKLSFLKKIQSQIGRSRPIWQPRFWDHVIRDERDMNSHIDYIHFNPVKHGLTKAPGEWEYSSFSEYLREGLYESDWGVKDRPTFAGEFGE